jgi:hypothetical protein
MRKSQITAAATLAVSLCLSGSAVAVAEPTPSPSPTTTIIRTPLEQYKYDREIYLNALKARDIAIRQINAAFKAAVEKSTQDYKVAMSLARTADQKVLANTNRKSAITTAINQRDAAIEELGEEPTPPIEPAKATRFKAPKEQSKGKNR